MAESIVVETLIRTRAVLINSIGNIVLCHHAVTLPGQWRLPGGDAMPGEHPDLAIVREVRKNTGMIFDTGSLSMVEEASDYDRISGRQVIQLDYRGASWDASLDPLFEGGVTEWKSPLACVAAVTNPGDRQAILQAYTSNSQNT